MFSGLENSFFSEKHLGSFGGKFELNLCKTMLYGYCFWFWFWVYVNLLYPLAFARGYFPLIKGIILIFGENYINGNFQLHPFPANCLYSFCLFV